MSALEKRQQVVVQLWGVGGGKTVRRILVHLQLCALDHLGRDFAGGLEQHDLIAVTSITRVGTLILAMSGRQSVSENAVTQSTVDLSDAIRAICRVCVSTPWA